MPVFLLKHFTQHTTVTESSPVLLLLDNHQSGVTIHSVTSSLNAGPSTSQGNHHVSLVDIRPSGVPRNFVWGGGGSTNSFEDRGQRKGRSGGGSPLVRGSGDSCNSVQEISFHIVTFY